MTHDDARERIPRIVKLLMAYNGVTGRTLSTAIGISEQSFSHRMMGRNYFTVPEIAAMAEMFDVDPRVWFDDPENALSYIKRKPAAVDLDAPDDLRSRCASPDDEPIFTGEVVAA